ncbi:MAG: J domain-containing protein [Terriglobia bacterium]
MIKDYYHLLGLSRTADLAEIKQAYRKLAALHHPDRVAEQGREALEQATRKMMELNEAFRILSDSERKVEYDQEIELIPERPLPAPRRAAAPSPPPQEATRPAPKPAPPPPSSVAAVTPVRPRRATEPRLEARADPEYGARLKAAVSRVSLNWTEQRLRGWDWVLEAVELRRTVLVLYRAMDSLSLLSARALQAALKAVGEQRKSLLRKTSIVAAVHIGRVMDAAAVREQLRGMALSTAGWLGSVQSLVILREGKNRPVVFGSVSEDAQVAEVVRRVQAVN